VIGWLDRESRLSWPSWLSYIHTEVVYPAVDGHPSHAYWAQHRITLYMQQMSLPLCQTTNHHQRILGLLQIELKPIQIPDLISVQSGWTSSRPDWRVTGVDRRGLTVPSNPCEWRQFVVRCLCVINSRLIAYNSIFTYITLKSIEMSITFIINT